MTAERKKEKSKELIRITKNVENSMENNRDNCKRYDHFRDFVLKSTMSTKQRNSLSALNKPVLEFNISESFLNRLRGEFAENEPSCSCSVAEGVKVDEQLEQIREICEGHMRYILAEAHRNGVFEDIFSEVVSGGFSASKISAIYENTKSFKQRIVWEKSWSPTLCGFDVLSRHPSGKDSMYAFELHPYTKDVFEQTYDMKLTDIDFSKSQENFCWYYKVYDTEIIIVCEYFEKKKIKTKIVELSTGEVINKKDYDKLVEQLSLQSLEAPPVITQERDLEEDSIIRYQLIGDTILEKEEVKNTNMLPLVLFSGNPTVLSNGSGKTYVMQRPFLYNIEGAQKMYNNIGVTLADETQTYSQQKIMIAEESISPNYVDNITQPQKYSTLVYRAFYNNNPDKPNPPPQQLARPCFSPEILSLWGSIPTLCQNILGSYDAQMGISGNTQISGVAITQGAIHSSATAKPYISNFMLCLNQVANVILNMIPKIYKGEFSLPIIGKDGKESQVEVNGQGQPSMSFDPSSLKIIVESGISSAANKQQSMQQLIQLSQASPMFGQFLNSSCLTELVGNLQIKDRDIIVLKAEKWQEEQKKLAEQQQQMAQQQMSQQISPMAVKQMEMQIKQQEIEAMKQKAEMQAQLDAKDLEIKAMEIQFKKEEMHSKLITENEYLELEKDKLDVTRAQVINEVAHKNREHEHRANVDHVKLKHQSYDLHHKHKVTGSPHY